MYCRSCTKLTLTIHVSSVLNISFSYLSQSPCIEGRSRHKVGLQTDILVNKTQCLPNEAISWSAFSISGYYPMAYYTPTRPSDWSVLGLAVMAWTATMASLILVWSSLNSVTCNKRIILAASFTAESEMKKIRTRVLNTANLHALLSLWEAQIGQRGFEPWARVILLFAVLWRRHFSLSSQKPVSLVGVGKSEGFASRKRLSDSAGRSSQLVLPRPANRMPGSGHSHR